MYQDNFSVLFVLLCSIGI